MHGIPVAYSERGAVQWTEKFLCPKFRKSVHLCAKNNDFREDFFDFCVQNDQFSCVFG